MTYRIAAIDVHKKMLAVVVADVAGEGEYQFERRKFGATPGELHLMAQWLVQQEVEEVVMESTAHCAAAQKGTGSQCGERWSGTGSRRGSSGRGPAKCAAHCTCAKPRATTDRGGERTISPTRNG
jgi:hypothetical protein